MNNNMMKILGEPVSLSNDFLDIYDLKFLRDNPRVYACMHGEPNFDKLFEGEQQKIIFEKLLQEPSVKNLIPDIKRHDGLLESIVIRYDTKEVIEGNSRLAVYRHLHQRNEEGEWGLIPCNIVSSLTENQQAAYLNQIHVKGRTRWSAYEKANFAYVRKERGSTIDKIGELFGESVATIRTRVKVVEMMKSNKDNQRHHFSYYDVLIRKSAIAEKMRRDRGFRDVLLGKIKDLGPDEENNEFTAQELRQKLPIILKKPRVLKKYIEGNINLDEGYQRARISGVEEKVRRAKGLLDDVTKHEVSTLEHSRFNAFKHDVRKLVQAIKRIGRMVDSISPK